MKDLENKLIDSIAEESFEILEKGGAFSLLKHLLVEGFRPFDSHPWGSRDEAILVKVIDEVIVEVTATETYVSVAAIESMEDPCPLYYRQFWRQCRWVELK